MYGHVVCRLVETPIKSVPGDVSMHSWITPIKALHRSEDGATATEYLILLILIACFVILIVKAFGETVENKFADGNNAVDRLVAF